MSINESMLLLDEALIDAESGIEREVHPGKKSDFVMEPDRDKPWEYSGPGMSKRIHLYGTTLYDDLMGNTGCGISPEWDHTGARRRATIRFRACMCLVPTRNRTIVTA